MQRLARRSSRPRGSSAKKLRLTYGEDRLMVVGQPDENQARCAACGSLLYSVVQEGAYIHLAPQKEY